MGHGIKLGQVYPNPFVNAFKPQVTEEVDDHEVNMAQGQLDYIIKSATELKGKLGNGEKNLPGWIQDHISKAHSYLHQANSGYHELGDKISVNESKHPHLKTNVKTDSDYSKVASILKSNKINYAWSAESGTLIFRDRFDMMKAEDLLGKKWLKENVNEATPLQKIFRKIGWGDVLNIVDTMSEKDIKDFAETPHKGLPKKVESLIRGLIRETYRNKVLSEVTRRSKDFFEDDNKYGIELHKLMRGKWDRDKALQYFIKLQSSIDNFSKYQNVLYFIANGLGINGRSYKNTVDLRDDIITAIGNLYKIHNESVNEAPNQKSNNFFKVNRHGYNIYNMLNGEWDRKKVEKYFDSLKSGENGHGGWFANLKGTAESVGVDPYRYRISRDKLVNAIIDGVEKLYKIHTESVNEESEQLDEKLITFSNRAPYGQVVFIAGGAGSGKGFAISNFIDSAGFKIRDVDEMKKQIQKLNAINKLSISDIINKFGNRMKPNDLDAVKKIQDDGFDLKTMNLKNPDHVYALHIMVKAMDIKDKSLENMIAAQSNPDTLPNIIFDITSKEINDITEVIPLLQKAGYSPKNIHLVWVLTNYETAIKQNAERERVVPADIMLKTHIGAGNTIWGIVTSALPKGMDGRVDVILNNRENTVLFTDKNGKAIKSSSGNPVVKGFLSLPVKKQGGRILPERLWKDILYQWIKDNGPKELTANFQ